MTNVTVYATIDSMATVTVRIRLRRSEGRHPVDEHTLAAMICEAIEDLDDFEIDDQSGEQATYEVTKADPIYTQPELIEVAERYCACGCGTILVDAPGGRPRTYATDTCRVRGYRANHRP